MLKDPVLCQWADCQNPSRLGVEFCREHQRCGADLVARAQDAALEYGDSLPDSKAYWAGIDSDPRWRRAWWEPPPRKPYRHISLHVRRKVAERHGCTFGAAVAVACPRCGAAGEIRWEAWADVRFVGMHLDHVRPVARGGRSTEGNIQLLCPACNLSKGARLEVEV